MLAKLNNIKSWQAALIISGVGFLTFFTGLKSPFFNDDNVNIVTNVPVHSIRNIKLFFEGGTAYNGHGLAPLSGVYYRPLLSTTYSIIYTIFGSHTLAFHLLQLILYIGCVFLLFLIFKFSFKPLTALGLSLIFMVHPINSQLVFAIAYMQDVLFFFFGLLAFYILIRFNSIKALIPVAVSLMLCMLSKETAVVFIALSLLYLFWFNRQRLFHFIGIMVPFVTVYLILKINAVGLSGNPHNGPIDNVNLIGRIFTAPSVFLFYITKFLFPWKLATGYFWVFPKFSLVNVLLPFLLDLVAVSVFIYIGFLIHKRLPKAQFYTFLFFGIWAALGIIPYLQIIPLDITASETWYYLSMTGMLGMIGVILKAYPIHIKPNWMVLVVVILICILGFRTAIRGLDWDHPTTLAYKDISVSKDAYTSYSNLAIYSINEGNYGQAKNYALKSVDIFPTFSNENNLGVAYIGLGMYPQAEQAFKNGLVYGSIQTLYEGLGSVSLVYGSEVSNKQELIKGLDSFPKDGNLWFCLAILEDKNNDNYDARVDINNAIIYGYPVSQATYDDIMNNQTFTLNFGSNKVIRI